MAFFDNLGKKISVVAGTAADKAKDLGEIAKLKAEILGIQSDINAALLELGRKTYEQSKSEAEGPYAADCARITGLYDQIVSLLSNPIIPMITIASLIPMRLPQSP